MKGATWPAALFMIGQGGEKPISLTQRNADLLTNG